MRVSRAASVWVWARRSITLPLIVALIVLAVFFSTQSEYFLTDSNFLNIGRQIAVTSIVALGVTVVLVAGEIDISMAGVIALTSVGIGFVLDPNDTDGTTSLTILALLLGLGIGLIVGLVNGLVVTVGRVPSFIATLGMLSIGTGLALNPNNGEPQALVSGQFLGAFARSSLFGIPVLVIYPLIAFVIVMLLLKGTVFGIQTYAVGGNSVAARLAGIPVRRVKIVAFALCGTFAGLAGVVASARVGSALPNLGLGIELDAIAAAVLGGTRLSGGFGTALGTILGAAVIGTVSNGLTLMGVASPIQNVIKGAVIIAAVVIDQLRRR